MSFSNMKKSSRMGFKQLSEKMSQESKGGSHEDSRFWTPDIDKSGSGFAVIRFLPSCEGEEYPFVKTFSHGFKHGTKWFIENCPTTIGKDCAVCDLNSELWNTNIKENQDIVRRRKRQVRYISNVLVLSDQKRPQNEGKVFLFSYGQKIFEKLMDAIEPQFADEKAFNPFDFWEGASFTIKIRNVEGFRNYDKSKFESPGQLFESDDEMEKVWKTQYPLKEFLSESQFKPYDEMKAKFLAVVEGAVTPPSRPQSEDEGDDVDRSKKSASSPSSPSSRPVNSPSDDDDDDAMKLYSSLVDD